MLHRILLLSLTFVLPFISLEGKPHNDQKECRCTLEESQDQKIYIQKDDLFILDNEIVIQINGQSCLLSQIHVDEEGLYFMMKDVKAGCWNGHTTWCKRCGGCGVLWCPGHCKCFG